MPKLTNGNVTPVSGMHGEVAGDRDRELAQRQHDPRDGDPAQERLLVVAQPPADATRRGSPRVDARRGADQPVQPQRAAERERPRRRSSRTAPTSAVNV